ncbi:hypothetical protein BU17DRAFT_64630 [Hysterangium stoloniferum]|nr:hypothetical protein BU17DRAFT_64630 [Hysterangium stoloniferum]
MTGRAHMFSDGSETKKGGTISATIGERDGVATRRGMIGETIAIINQETTSYNLVPTSLEDERRQDHEILENPVVAFILHGVQSGVIIHEFEGGVNVVELDLPVFRITVKENANSPSLPHGRTLIGFSSSTSLDNSTAHDSESRISHEEIGGLLWTLWATRVCLRDEVWYGAMRRWFQDIGDAWKKYLWWVDSFFRIGLAPNFVQTMTKLIT